MIEINQDRLWKRLMEMAEIGGLANGGCNRQALTNEDKVGRDLFVSWATKAGCKVDIDAVGNIFITRKGKTDLPAIMTGSHLDTQPTGGKFDGVLGVLAGLEVIERLNELDIETERAIQVVSWTNEEGARFSPALIGSGVYCDVFALDDVYQTKDRQGITVQKSLEDIGFLGDAKINYPAAFFELHIEQGPILEAQEKDIGIVTGIQGMHWHKVCFLGKSVHAGSTPMTMRHDPMFAASALIQKTHKMVTDVDSEARFTVGYIHATPGVTNTVPNQVELTLDIRHPNQSVLDVMDADMQTLISDCAKAYGVSSTLQTEWLSPAIHFAKNNIELVRNACQDYQYSAMEMVSGAGHDSAYLHRVTPTSMIFIPCEGGISHNEAENITKDQAFKGANILLSTLVRAADTK